MRLVMKNWNVPSSKQPGYCLDHSVLIFGIFKYRTWFQCVLRYKVISSSSTPKIFFFSNEQIPTAYFGITNGIAIL